MDDYLYNHKINNIKYEWGLLATKKAEGRALTPTEDERERYLRKLLMKFV